MRKKLAAAFSCLVLLAVSILWALPEGSADEQPVAITLWASYWSVKSGFSSTLTMKNNRIDETITARVSLYFEDGEEYYLDPLFLAPRQTAVISLNQVHESLPKSVRRRASKEGTLAVEFTSDNASAVMGSISVTNPDEGLAWNFRLYAALPMLAANPLWGPFWFPDARSDGFVAVQNISEQFTEVTARFHVRGEIHSLLPVRLAPGQGYKLELRKELHGLGLKDATAGGIELAYEGERDGLRAHGVLFNGHGFSTEVAFQRSGILEEAKTFTLRTPRFALGPADPRLGLSGNTRFEPTLALHNFGDSEMSATLFVGYRTAGAAQEAQFPLELAGGETRLIPLSELLEETVPEEVSWASLEVSYASRENQLAGALVSVSEDGEHSITSVLNTVDGIASEGWYWEVTDDTDTLLGILNTDTEEATVAVTLDYAVEGRQFRYDVAEITIPPRSSELVDLGSIVRSGFPDADGDVIPDGVSYGGYRVQKTGSGLETVITEALVVNRREKSFLSFYNTCCGVSTVFVDPSSMTGPAGSSGTIKVWGLDACSHLPVSLAVSFSSANETIATVTPQGSRNFLLGITTGTVSLLSPGSTSISVHSTVPVESPFCASTLSDSSLLAIPFPDPGFCNCINLSRTDSVGVTVTPPAIFVSLSPVSVPPESQTTVTVSTLPAISGLSVSLSRTEVANSGGHLHLGRPLGSFAASSGTTNAQGKFTTTYTASKFGGEERITATAGGATGDGLLFVRITAPLSILGPGANYELKGSTTEHPGNHYATATANSNLVTIADQYAAQFPGSVLRYDDQSLEMGGLFDIGPRNTCIGCLFWNPPHDEHRLGTNVDVSDRNVPQERWGILEDIFRANGDLNPKHEIAKRHWHLRF